MIGYPFRKMLANVITWIGKEIIVGTFLLIKFITQLISASDSDYENIQGEGGMGALPPAEKNELLDFILWVAVVGITIILIYIYRYQIIAFIKEKIRRLKELFKKLYIFLFKKREQQIDVQCDYIDTVEAIEDIDTFKKQNIGGVHKTKWKKQVKKYLALDEAQNSYREGYQLLVKGVQLKGIEIKGNYTPREIRRVVEEKIKELSLKQETNIYEAVRYGESGVSVEEIARLKYVLKQLLMLNK